MGCFTRCPAALLAWRGLAWAAPPGPLDASPAIAHGMAFVGSNDTNVYALDARTGALAVHTFDAADGTPLWTVLTGGRVRSSPAVANGVVYVGVGDGSIYAVDAGAGTLLWSAATSGLVAVLAGRAERIDLRELRGREPVRVPAALRLGRVAHP